MAQRMRRRGGRGENDAVFRDVRRSGCAQRYLTPCRHIAATRQRAPRRLATRHTARNPPHLRADVGVTRRTRRRGGRGENDAVFRDVRRSGCAQRYLTPCRHIAATRQRAPRRLATRHTATNPPHLRADVGVTRRTRRRGGCRENDAVFHGVRRSGCAQRYLTPCRHIAATRQRAPRRLATRHTAQTQPVLSVVTSGCTP